VESALMTGPLVAVLVAGLAPPALAGLRTRKK
jgi:hypothetical protein